MTPDQKKVAFVVGGLAAIGGYMWYTQRSASASPLPAPSSGGLPGAPATARVTNYPASYMPVPGTTTSSTPDTSRGDPIVMEYQRRLSELGYDPGPIDGRYGSLTKNAVMDFQRDQNLTVDGKMGPRTRAAIDAAYGTPAPATAVSGLGTRVAWRRY